jgi:hypothetical protein
MVSSLERLRGAEVYAGGVGRARQAQRSRKRSSHKKQHPARELGRTSFFGESVDKNKEVFISHARRHKQAPIGRPHNSSIGDAFNNPVAVKDLSVTLW